MIIKLLFKQTVLAPQTSEFNMGCVEKTPAASVATEEYFYEENLSVMVKDTEVGKLNHYFGDLLRDETTIDKKHKYCALCLASNHVVKR